MASHRPSLPVRQVGTLLDEHPSARLVIFVPRPQLGTALRQAVVRDRGSAAGLTATTVEGYARELAELDLHCQGRSELDTGPQFFLAARTLHHLDDEQRMAFTGEQPLSGTIAPLARTFATLRTHQVSPSYYRNEVAGSERQEAQAEAFARYEQLLDEQDWYDTATLFDTAEGLVRASSVDISSTVWAIDDTVTLSTVEHHFVEALQDQASTDPGLYRIGLAHRSSPSDFRTETAVPPTAAAAHFSKAPCPDPSAPPPSGVGKIALRSGATLRAEEIETLRFWTATGTRREVQAVFDDILDQDRPLDTVEIAYTSPDPYLPLLDTLAERYEIPVSLSGGRSIDATRPGQALRGFFDWVANGCPIPDLITLLRAGLLRPDVPIGDDDSDGRLDNHRAATLLAEKRYPDDCRKYADTFAAWSERIQSELREIEDAVDASWGDDSLRRLREKRAAVDTLANMVDDLLTSAHINSQGAVSPKDLSSGAEAVLEKYGPTPKPVSSEEERTPGEAARNRLIDRLRAVHESGDGLRLPPRRLAGRMKTWLDLSPYVRAQHPRPGRAHVVPLESAGYADRAHLYVVGLDAASARSAVPDDPLLSDAEREALSGDARAIPLRRADADAQAWRTRRALTRHEGSVTLSASTYDLTENEDLFEAPLYLQLKEASQTARDVGDDAHDPHVVHHPLANDPDTFLSDLDRWTSQSRPTSTAVDEALDSRVPWIRQGLDAEAARTSETYTVHDGLLSPRSYPALDPLAGSRPVSAGQLETYAQAPYAYFLRYILDVAPLDEPALDDVAWLDAQGRGAVLHDTFRRFMDRLNRQPTRDDESLLRTVFEAVLDERRTELPPPSEVVFASTRRQLWTDARLFLRAEVARTDPHTPHAFELGFGVPPHHRTAGDYSNAPTLDLNDCSFALRGRIDRVDRFPDGSFAVWDYKTGSSRSFDESDLLGDLHLQWALYAYALEALEDATVTTAGYFFTSADEMGKRIAASPTEHKEAVARIVQRVSDGIGTGAFPVTDADILRYSYAPLFPDYGERRKQLRAKDWPDDRPAPPVIHDD